MRVRLLRTRRDADTPVRSTVAISQKWRLPQGVLLFSALAYAVSTVVRHGHFVAALDLYMYHGLFFGGIALCLLRSATVRDNERFAWLLFAGGLASFSAGDMYWTVKFSGLDTPPTVSLADLGYLGFYPCCYVGLISLIRARTSGTPRSVWLDGIVGGLATASVSAATFFDPIARSSSGGIFFITVNMAYPAADLLLLVLVVCSFAMSGWKPGRSWLFLSGALITLALSDTFYLYKVATDTYKEGTLLDAGWPFVAVVIGLAAWRTPKKTSAEVFESRMVVVMPMVFAVVALGVLTGNRLFASPSVAIALALASIVVGFIRLALTFREVQALSVSRREARTDELTSLGNRRMFYESMERALGSNRADRSVALLLIDLDRFKEINDSLGHQFGDRLLRQIGPRLQSAVPTSAIVTRLGGDEFAVVMENADMTTAVKAARTVQAAVDAPFELDGVPVKVTASIGIAMFPDHAVDANQLLRHADVAMYAAKEERAQHRVYSPEQDMNSRARLNTIHQLRSALEQDRLVVHYQPKLSADGKFAGAEALVRMRGANGAMVPPDKFLPLAEQAGLMRILTGRVLDIVLTDIAAWARQGHNVKVAVNLSVTNLLDDEFPAHVAQALEQHRLRGSSLVFEITETTVLTDPERALLAVKRLRSLGAELSLDDYGTGYASLAYLRQMPLNELKLDRSFVSDLESDDVAGAFFTTTVQLAHVLGLRVVAEGIETDRMWELARAAGCDVGQGYFFSRPQPADEFLQTSLSFGLAAAEPLHARFEERVLY